MLESMREWKSGPPNACECESRINFSTYNRLGHKKLDGTVRIGEMIGTRGCWQCWWRPKNASQEIRRGPMGAVGVGKGLADEGMRVERKGSGEGEKMTAEGGLL